MSNYSDFEAQRLWKERATLVRRRTVLFYLVTVVFFAFCIAAAIPARWDDRLAVFGFILIVNVIAFAAGQRSREP